MTGRNRNSVVASPAEGTERIRWLNDRAPDLFDEYGSPLFVVDEGELRQNYHDLRGAFDGSLRCEGELQPRGAVCAPGRGLFG